MIKSPMGCVQASRLYQDNGEVSRARDRLLHLFKEISDPLPFRPVGSERLTFGNEQVNQPRSPEEVIRAFSNGVQAAAGEAVHKTRLAPWPAWMRGGILPLEYIRGQVDSGEITAAAAAKWFKRFRREAEPGVWVKVSAAFKREEFFKKETHLRGDFNEQCQATMLRLHEMAKAMPAAASPVVQVGVAKATSPCPIVCIEGNIVRGRGGVQGGEGTMENPQCSHESVAGATDSPHAQDKKHKPGCQ